VRIERILEHRKPFEALEVTILERDLTRPGEVSPHLLAGLRYVVSFCKIGIVRRRVDGVDVDVSDFVRPLAYRVRDLLQRRLGPEEPTLWGAVRALPELVDEVRAHRDALKERFGLGRQDVDREVTHRKIVVALGGGGGAGYGYAGALRALDREGLPVHLICGTSIGALSGLFRARRGIYDPAPVYAALRDLSWNKVFTVGPQQSRYGLPATLRLHLRAAIGRHFRGESGDVLTMRELGVPMHIVATGLTVDTLKHELSYYEHFLDDVVRPGMIFRVRGLARMGKVVEIFRELMSDPHTLKRVVFGLDPLTLDADCIDAAGFSASVPGLIHYDILRDAPRMTELMDRLYAEHGITRLTEGGVVENVPSRVAYESVMRGTLDGHRNAWILAFDCFAPNPRSLVWYPVQQLVRGNTLRSAAYADVYVPLSRVLNPANLVPSVEQVEQASDWLYDDMAHHVPITKAICTAFPPL